MQPYAELHAKSFFSFGEGASHVHELLAQAAAHGYSTLALTDTNLCGALDFAKQANALGIKPITGGELALTDGSRIVLLARNREGYANLCRLLTLANHRDRRKPNLDTGQLQLHAEGLALLTGGRNGPLSKDPENAPTLLRNFMDWFGAEHVHVELNRNFLQDDLARNRALTKLAHSAGARTVATNNVHYHIPERHRLQQALTAARLNLPIGAVMQHVHPNSHLCLKPEAAMRDIMKRYPQAVDHAQAVAEQCEFNLETGLGYSLPDAQVPPGHTPDSYLEQLCREAAARRYGRMTSQVEARLQEELRLIRLHNIAGFLLLYREIVLLAQEIMEEKGISKPETPLEERPPGRGRGSSVALLTGYLTGISHVDPLRWNLTLERFMSEETPQIPDIDLDFPRALRGELIERAHRHFGTDFAVLTGAISTYHLRGVIQDLGKALGLPREDLKRLKAETKSEDPALLEETMLEIPGLRDRAGAPGWKELAELAPQLHGAPRSLGQHVGGLILSSAPIPDMTPVRPGATQGRYIMDWDKDSVNDAGFAKIDLLSLPALDQLEEALNLVEQIEGQRPDIAAIDPEDPDTYRLIAEGRTKGVFMLQSPAQISAGKSLQPQNLMDLACQLALVRPGVGVQGNAPESFIQRYRYAVPWEYDHPLEKRALERTCGVILWQEQAIQVIMDIAGFTAAQADQMRRAFTKPNAQALLEQYRQRFMAGAREKGIPEQAALRIMSKLNGHYMFPESHSHAFAVTALQCAWPKRNHPTEFYTALMNNQPMGFYPLETIKQDAKRHHVPFLNPCVNRSQPKCTPDQNAVLIGLNFVKDIGPAQALKIVEGRERNGPYASAQDLARRTGLTDQAISSLVKAGALDSLHKNRRDALWNAGPALRPGRNGQVPLPLDTSRGAPPGTPDFSPWECMAGEYEAMGIYPEGHLMEFLRQSLPKTALSAAQAERAHENETVTIAGCPVTRQHPGSANVVFVTLEDETGDLQLLLSEETYARRRREVNSPAIIATGQISRKNGGSPVIIVSVLRTLHPKVKMPPAHDWH